MLAQFVAEHHAIVPTAFVAFGFIVIATVVSIVLAPRETF
jgi:hypothetical protein